MTSTERAEWCKKNNVPVGWLLMSENEIAIIKAELAQLYAALRKYGNHKHGCPPIMCVDLGEFTTGPCTCGLSELLEGGK